MDHPKWKKWLSYFTEISLEKSSSPSNPYLEVLLTHGRHQLVTKDAIYSYDDKYDNFYQAFKQMNWDKLSGDRVLVLGLGLGSVIYMLEKIFHQQFSFTAVEVDSEICRLCNKYTLSKIDSYVEVIPTEAMQFLQTHSEAYDMIIMDIFQSAVIPEKFQSIDYLSLLNSKLKNNGVLLYNRMNITDQDQDDNEQFRSTMETVFPHRSEVKIKTNLVMISDRSFLIDKNL